MSGLSRKDIFERNLERFIYQELPALLGAEHAVYFRATQQRSRFNKSSLLIIRSDLLRSTLSQRPRKPEARIFEVINEGKGVFGVRWGIRTDRVPYAWIHEKGGFIPVTPRSRGFFIARWLEGGPNANEWFAMAKSRKNAFYIRPRSYFFPALEVFADRDLPKHLEKLWARIRNEWREAGY